MKSIIFFLILSITVFINADTELISTRFTYKIYFNNEYFGKQIDSEFFDKGGIFRKIYLSEDNNFFILLELDNFIYLSKKMKDIFASYDEFISSGNKEMIEKEKEKQLEDLFQNVFHIFTIGYKNEKFSFKLKYKRYGQIILTINNENKTFNEGEFFKFLSSLFSENVEKFLNLWKCDCEYFFNENGYSICNDKVCNNYKYEKIFVPCERSEEIAIGIECLKKPENAMEKIKDNMQVIYFRK